MSKDALIEAVEQQHIKQTIPTYRVGDSLKVSVRIVDVGGKERVQQFTGTLIAQKGAGSAETITLHRFAYGSGMERVFFIHSPLVISIEVVRTGKVRRSKLYYLRGTSGKATKVKERYVSGKGKKKGPAISVEEIVEESEVIPVE
jgi:large subunit ribosomal protein L19